MIDPRNGARGALPESSLLTFREAMTFLRVSRSTLSRLIASGQLRGHKVGSTWRFYQHDLLAAITQPGGAPAERRALLAGEGLGAQ